ncbi:hypothetical protein AB0D47_20045 [Streptomyces sp. NPDC048376]|uniref:hypothetical protein n=1 Tax=Streptomyces sp. NPDC048376 TaxID=3154926 RepID=UPI0034314380
MTTPADELRTAAAKLRKLVADLPATGWGDRPWHVEECSDTDDMSPCPCIVAQGEYRDFDQPQEPLIQYVADAETVEHGAYIAAMHPGVASAFANLLESVSYSPDDEALNDPGSDRHDACDRAVCIPAAALAVARQINATGSPAAG